MAHSRGQEDGDVMRSRAEHGRGGRVEPRGASTGGWLAVCLLMLLAGLRLGAQGVGPAAAVPDPAPRVSPATASCENALTMLEQLDRLEADTANRLVTMVNSPAAATAQAHREVLVRIEAWRRWSAGPGVEYARDRAACVAPRG